MDDGIDYSNAHLKKLEKQGVTINYSDREDLMEIYGHGLHGYRVGDTFVKRAALQAKDLTQAATHFNQEGVFAKEYGDYVNNKVGFYLRDKYQDNEKLAMEELGKMIDNRDERLYFMSNIDKKE